MKRKRDSIAHNTRANKKGKEVKGEIDKPESEELEPFANLPSDVTTHILLQLPIKSIATCRRVCRTWNALISDPVFAKLQLECASLEIIIRTADCNRVSRTLHFLDPEKLESECNTHDVMLEPAFKLPLCDPKLAFEKREIPLRGATKLAFEKRDETKDWVRRRTLGISSKRQDEKFGVVNSCNGLICLHHPWKRDPLVVCNPVTGEFIRLPKSGMRPFNPTEKTWGQVCGAGFGFQPKTNEYKVVTIWMKHVTIKEDSEVFDCVVVEMNTLGTPTWKNVGVDPGFLVKKLECPTYVNGALHWISFDGGQRSILCFTFESEKFQSFPFPPYAPKDDEDMWHIRMAELGGFLYICDASSRVSCIMWLMKNYGVGESWTKAMSIDNLTRPQGPYGLCWPVKHSKKGAAILMQNFRFNCFVYYEPEKFRFKIFRVLGTQSVLFEVLSHTPSLISLKDIVKQDNTEVLNFHSRCAKIKLQEENEVLFWTHSGYLTR